MDSIRNAVHYCCVSKSNRVLYAYNGEDHETENLASMCLEKTPPFHKWYFETKCKRTFGFLIEDGHVYFTIVDDGFGKPGLLKFLEHLRDEFKKIAKKSSRGSFSSMNTTYFQEQLVPVIRHLIFSLEHVSGNENDLKSEIPSPSNIKGTEVSRSTKAPLLGKSSKHEKKKTKEHVVSVRDNELEERRKSTDRGVKIDESSNQGATISPQKDSFSIRMRSAPQNIRRKWWRQVMIVLAIDAVICLVLFVVWLSICHGFECTQ